MADTYEAFYNGKPLNPNRGLPTMTYAQAEASGLTESERLWCRTDGEDTQITADDIEYSTGVSVKDKIDDLSHLELLYTINANTYSNWGDALKKLYEIYSTLSLDDKVHCLIVRNDDICYSISGISSAFKTSYPSSTTNSIEEAFFLATGIYLRNTFTVGGNVATTNKSAESQGQVLKMYLTRGN